MVLLAYIGLVGKCSEAGLGATLVGDAEGSEHTHQLTVDPLVNLEAHLGTDECQLTQ